MSNPVFILSYNGLPFLQRCIESVKAQDVPTSLYIADNGSSDGTREFLMTQPYRIWLWDANRGVSRGWNAGLKHIFDEGAEHVFCLNQDLILPSYFCSEMLDHNVPFVTGFPVSTAVEIGPLTASEGARKARADGGLEPHPCFSAFLIRRECWETVGPFDERMVNWASDCDFHVRGHRKGVGMWKSKVPFLHFPGTTTRTAPPDEQQWFMERANKDRAEFKTVYGCEPGEPAYSNLFAPESFGGYSFDSRGGSK